jgi:hypothetical protein
VRLKAAILAYLDALANIAETANNSIVANLCVIANNNVVPNGDITAELYVFTNYYTLTTLGGNRVFDGVRHATKSAV